ncbi:uncharacterized protein Z520_00162 [Fonsecaea multimorphosa CBS 102226]|uniref:Uncharacterized protein n=1 Tax=Fonsecaea multimorphosa CBS 102226 TaxID=1442371 RepID=A0A0D2HNT3_9EURO|nr:uncharacterized protein Z520_00162 [Fonsecaea multimorphosa CBS 102226]KIY03471.1 hypothetical protein Z520_00162 [Fonsecaea multimorphosa CBS 102226]OAL32729.1 hypothetical protein AYO22_00203 [Fonsecaea multimorphosa]
MQNVKTRLGPELVGGHLRAMIEGGRNTCLPQTGVTLKQNATVDELAQHIAFIITEVARGVGKESGGAGQGPGTKKFAFTIEPTVEAQTGWTQRIVSGAAAFIAMSNCPPSYFNAEGDL